MEPAIPLGGLVIVKPTEGYVKDDVITFRSEADPKQTVTHRIVEIVEDEDLKRISYKTKGDANEEADRELVDSRRVIGRVVYTVPYLGYVVSFAQTQVGFVVLVVIPATIIIYSELLKIKSEVGEFIKKRKVSKKGSKGDKKEKTKKK
jgi:signal peptidase